MGTFSILLCDSDKVYANRLAAGLQRQFQKTISVRTVSDFAEVGESVEADVVLGNRLPDSDWRQDHPNCTYIWLDEGAGAGSKVLKDEGVWQTCVFKYQSVSKIASALQGYLPTRPIQRLSVMKEQRQRWFGVVSPDRHASTIPFACSLASQLGKNQRVLLLDFMEFSGMLSLLEIDSHPGIESFLLRLHQNDSLEEIPFPLSYGIKDFDLLHGPDNPMVLYELNEMDIGRLIEYIQVNTRYDNIVWVGGNMIPGIDNLFDTSKRIFCVSGEDRYSICCRQEFEVFFKKVQQGDKEVLSLVKLPVLGGMYTGEHLLWQWNHSVIGDTVKRFVKEEISDGTVGEWTSKEDIRSVGGRSGSFRQGFDVSDR